ncbi:MAG: FapA family protein [Spirochaetales bacterium]|nr:FapA family protein [Spirochaetales bacterium]
MSEQEKITGSFDIDTDDEGLLAVLNFTPDDNGEEFDKPAVYRLINEKKIVNGLDKKKLENELNTLFSKPVEFSITLAEGSPPELAVPTSYEWEPFEIPKDKKKDLENFLQNAPPPDIFRIEVEKVKRETIVKKKSRNPFGKDKQEKVVDYIKKEKKIKIDVLPDTIEAGWVEADAPIGKVFPGKPGSIGKDVFGMPINPPASEDEFWLGNGVEAKSSVLSASYTGIIRRGWNWIEILPFKTHDWKLELSKDKNTCLLSFTPGGADAEPPQVSKILKRGTMLGFAPETLYSESQLNELINTAIKEGKPLSKTVISTDDDGFFEIKVSDDKIKAEMILHKSRGNGKPLVLKEAGAAIKSSGLKGIDLKKTQDIILEFYKGPETDITFTLATGSKAEDGSIGDLVYNFEPMKDSAAEDIKKRITNLNERYVKSIKSSTEYPLSDFLPLTIAAEGQAFATLSISKGKNGKDVFGESIDSVQPDFSAYKTLENVKFHEGKLVAEKKGLLERSEKDGTTVFRIREHADSEIHIGYSDNRMEGYLTIDPAIGTGAPPSLEDVNMQLSEAGITTGIDNEVIKKTLERSRGGEPIRYIVIAKGKPPVNGGECEIEHLVDLSGNKSVTIDESGKANYRNQKQFTSAKEGDKLVLIKKAGAEAEDGWDICGKTITAKKTAALNLTVGANIKEVPDEEGNTVLVAEKPGRIVFEKNKIEIQESIFIKGDVDFGTGNIKFAGDVNVNGNVRSGFVVMAGGNVSVKMNSEMSLLSSEKSVMVGQGIKGGGKAVVRAQDSIQVSFAERATLLSVNNITVKNAVFGCKVKCNGRLKLLSEKGYLVGGHIQAKNGIEAMNIGSLSGSRTEISFGQDYLISDKIETEEREIEKIKKRIIKINTEMVSSEKNKDNKKLNLLRAEKVKMMKIMEKRGMRVFTLKERFEQHFPGDIIIRGEVFPGVVFESHGRTLEVLRKAKSIKIIFNQETGTLEQVPFQPKKK